MDKQMIEEMAKVLESKHLSMCTWDSYNDDFNDNYPNECKKVAAALYDAGYRKIPEGAVVLTEKEYKRYERIEKTIKLAKMYKANGYEVKNGKLYYFSNMLDGCEIEFKDMQEICDMANHYNEEFFGLDQRLTFWQGKAEEARKETAEKFAERLKERSFDEYAPDGRSYECVAVSDIDEICKELTEGKNE